MCHIVVVLGLLLVVVAGGGHGDDGDEGQAEEDGQPHNKASVDTFLFNHWISYKL